MNKKLLLATGNMHKKQELQDMLSGIDIDVLGLQDIEPLPGIEEDGTTFAENAVKKSSLNAARSGMICLADDSGLVVDALNGQPGIYSARFAGENAGDAMNNDKLLGMMAGVKEDRRTARFVCVIAISDPRGETSIVEGVCEGRIAWAPSGTGGFGYDPLFIPTGYEQSFAELSAAEKNNISHRGRALQKAAPIIAEILKRE